MALKKKSILLSMAFLIGCFVCACGKEDSIVDESLVKDTEDVSSTEEIKSAEEEAAEQWEKGYDLPIDEQEREEAETDCKKQMELYLDIYETADKGIACLSASSWDLDIRDRTFCVPTGIRKI